MPPEHHDRPQCGGSGNGNQSTNDAARMQSPHPQQQPQQPQQIASNGAGRLFYLKPALRECFSCVGATARQYLWKEVLNLLRDYIYKKDIIDKNNKYKIDCKNDPLSLVLGVDSFLYGEQVKKLFSEQVVAITNDNTVPILTEPPVDTRPSTSGLPGSARLKEYYASINWSSCFPEVPAPKPDDIESIYSYQGYETVSCHNTEYEESEAEELSSYEEYEVASDDAQEASVPSEDNETDVEVLNIDFYEYQDQDHSESDFADEDSNSSDDDDLSCFKWKCIKCGLIYHPFVNYCEQCWIKRKDILPDRPKRKRRKPRIKKRQRKLSEKQEPSTSIHENVPPVNFDRSVSLDSANVLPCSMLKSKSQDSVDVISRTIDYTSSQDSGIGSQEFITEEIFPEIKMSDKEIKESVQKTESLIEPSSSKSFKKRQRSSSEERETSVDRETTKRIRIEESEDRDWGKLLQTESFKEWLSSEEGNKFLSSKSEIMLMHSCSGEASKPSGLSTLCSICLHRPKNGSIVHGRISHISTCYPCAKRLLDTGSRCPVCRRKIHMVTKTIVA